MGRAYQNRKESMAKTSDAKAKVYSKFSREIYVTAKSGGIEVEGNLALAGLIERAKKPRYLLTLSTKHWIKRKAAAVKILLRLDMKVLAQAAAW